jgi:hypothetical protein
LSSCSPASCCWLIPTIAGLGWLTAAPRFIPVLAAEPRRLLATSWRRPHGALTAAAWELEEHASTQDPDLVCLALSPS